MPPTLLFLLFLRILTQWSCILLQLDMQIVLECRMALTRTWWVRGGEALPLKCHIVITSSGSSPELLKLPTFGCWSDTGAAEADVTFEIKAVTYFIGNVLTYHVNTFLFFLFHGISVPAAREQVVVASAVTLHLHICVAVWIYPNELNPITYRFINYTFVPVSLHLIILWWPWTMKYVVSSFEGDHLFTTMVRSGKPDENIRSVWNLKWCIQC